MKSMHLTIKTKCTISEEIDWQSQELLQDTGIFEFVLKTKQDFFCETYHSEIKRTIALLSQNQITRITRRSPVQEVKFLYNFFSSQKHDIFYEQGYG